MCMIDSTDGYWRIYGQVEHRASKAHRCRECGRTINVGERYLVWRGLDEEGVWCGGKACAHCRAASRWLSEVCGGFVTEEILSDLTEHWQEGAQYRTPWLARAIVGLRRKWKRRDGSLMPAPGEPVYTPELEPYVQRRERERMKGSGEL